MRYLRQSGFYPALSQTLFWTLIGALVLGLSACQGSAGKLSEAAYVETGLGPIQGVTTETPDIYNFKGLPYAQAPVGDLRWRPPAPVTPWTQTRKADQFSLICMQGSDSNEGFISRIIKGHGLGPIKRFLINRVAAALPDPEQSEDCLYLNVRTGNLTGETAQPVMVWIHGGGHQFGSSDLDYYQTNGLVEQGVVLVTINYRLGAFGYMAHPALSVDDPRGVSGNYGTLDQIAALEWVRDHIADFGGDPNNVTIFGESAGAWSVSELMASPLASGLFHKAIGQSGASSYHLGQMEGEGVGWPNGYSAGLAVSAALGLDNPTAADLRAIPAQDIRAVITEPMTDGFHQNRDGVVFPDGVGLSFLNGTFNAVPSLFGYNSDEGTLFFPTDPEPSVWIEGFPRTGRADQIASLQTVYGDGAESLVDLYALDDPGNFDTGGAAMMGDDIFGINVRWVTRANARAGQPAYLYTFGRVPPSPKQTIGAFHAAEIPFVFDAHEPILGVSDDDRAITRAMVSYWTNFAKTGNPNGEGLPDWPEHAGENWMQFGGNNDLPTGAVKHFRKDKLDALEVGLTTKLSKLQMRLNPEPIQTLPSIAGSGSQ